jgi:hypothetical protein
MPFSFNIELFDNDSLNEYRGKYFYNVSRLFFMDGQVFEFPESY